MAFSRGPDWTFADYTTCCLTLPSSLASESRPLAPGLSCRSFSSSQLSQLDLVMIPFQDRKRVAV